MASLASAEALSRAVLYEGYLLYPYYTQSPKNRFRFQFGGLYPPSYAEAQSGADRACAATEFLVRAPAHARLSVSLRGLQLLGEDPAADDSAERRLALPAVSLGDLEGSPFWVEAAFGAGGPAFASFRIEVFARALEPSLYRVRACATNETAGRERDRAAVLRQTLFSAHFLCGIESGEFISQIDPPPELAAAAAGCRAEGLYPVLAGEAGRGHCLLAAPIILYDYPAIAPESRGDLFDGLEIDEILSLRIRTLTEPEKEAVRASGPRPAALLERTERLTDEELLGLHGGRREAGAPDEFRPGDRVRLRPSPKRGGDIFDLALAGRAAVVEKLERTLEEDCLVAVTIDDDPGRDLGRQGMIGHRFFFRPEELERLHG